MVTYITWSSKTLLKPLYGQFYFVTADMTVKYVLYIVFFSSLYTHTYTQPVPERELIRSSAVQTMSSQQITLARSAVSCNPRNHTIRDISCKYIHSMILSFPQWKCMRVTY